MCSLGTLPILVMSRWQTLLHLLFPINDLCQDMQNLQCWFRDLPPPRSCNTTGKQCPGCGKWVGLGGKGDDYPLSVHINSWNCIQATTAQVITREVLASTLFCPFTALLPSPTSTLPNGAAFSSTSPEMPPSNIFPPSSPPPPYQLSTTSTSTLTSSSPVSSSILPLQIQTIHKVPCARICLKWVCKHPAQMYPIQYHSMGNLMWSTMAAGPHNPNSIYVQSSSCDWLHNPFIAACTECMKIPSSTQYQALEGRALKVPAPSMPYVFLSWEQPAQKAKDKSQQQCCQLHKRVCQTLQPQISQWHWPHYPERCSHLQGVLVHMTHGDYEHFIYHILQTTRTHYILQVVIKNGSSSHLFYLGFARLKPEWIWPNRS